MELIHIYFGCLSKDRDRLFENKRKEKHVETKKCAVCLRRIDAFYSRCSCGSKRFLYG
jgi:hypothetical protein